MAGFIVVVVGLVVCITVFTIKEKKLKHKKQVSTEM